MSKKIQLNIENPCHENWDQMTPSEKGRFCASCQKQVIDFTGMSDSQLAAFFKKPTTGSTCGRFYQDQLDHDIVIPKKRIPWVKYFFQFALPAFLLSMRATAQGNIRVGKPAIAIPAKNAKAKTVGSKIEITHTRKYRLITGAVKFNPTTLSLSNETSVKGRVMNEENKPIPFASVIVKGTRGLGVSADSSGVFSFAKLPLQDELTLEVSSVGYIAKEIVISKETDLSGELVIKLGSPVMENIDVVVVGRMITLGGYRMSSVCIKGSSEKRDSTLVQKREKAPEIISAIKLYPNPVARSSSVQIEFNSTADEMIELLITGMNGSIVLQRKEKVIKGFNRISVTADARWAAGTYILRLTNGKGSVIKQEKLVVQ